MTSDIHPWAKCLTRPDGLQLIRHHITASHRKHPSHQTCSISSDLLSLLTLYPWLTQQLFKNQPDHVIQCVANLLSQGDFTLELLLQLQAGQFDTLLTEAILGAKASVREQYIATLSCAVSALPALIFSRAPIEFRIGLCRHFLSTQRPVSELMPLIDNIIDSSANCQALVLDLFCRLENDADVLFSIITSDKSRFPNVFLQPMIESAQSPSIRFFELILIDDELRLMLLNPVALSKHKASNSFKSKLSISLTNIWDSSLFNVTVESYRLLLALRQRLLIEEEALIELLKAQTVPTPARTDIFRFCLLSGLSKHKQLFLFILNSSTKEDLTVVGSTLTSLLTHQQVFSNEILEDSLCSLHEFLGHQPLIESLLSSFFFVHACIRNLKALNFLHAIAEEHRGLINVELGISTIMTSLRQISDGCTHSAFLVKLIAVIFHQLLDKLPDVDDLIHSVLGMDCVSPDVCDMLVESISPLFADSGHTASVYKALCHYDSRRRPLALRLILKIFAARQSSPPDIALVRLWIAPPYSAEDELVLVKVLHECLNVTEDIMDLIPFTILQCLTFSDINARASCTEFISSIKHDQHRSSALNAIRWKLQEIEYSKWIGYSNFEDAKASILLKDIVSRIQLDDISPPSDNSTNEIKSKIKDQVPMSGDDDEEISHDLAECISSELANSCLDVWTQSISPFACIACTNNDLTYDIVSKRLLPPAPFANTTKKQSTPIRNFNDANQIPNSNTKPLHGIHIWPDGDYYKGWWLLGERDGHGQLFALSGAKYDGKWKEGLPDGNGYFISSSGSEYKGQFRKGLRHGFGRLFHRKQTYEGEWYEGLRQGNGRQLFPNGVQYHGQWYQDLPHGQGTLTYPTGDEYAGSFHSGRRHGRGKWTASGYEYNGEWLNDKRDGYGVAIYSNRCRYEGHWHNGFKEGHGVYIWASIQIINDNGVRYRFEPGDCHAGLYKRGKRSGPGTFYHCDGRVYDAIWLSDCRSEQVVYRSEFGGKRKRLIPDRFRGRAHHWSVEVVANFLKQLTHSDERIAQLVKQSAITGHKLLQLKDEELIQLLHINRSDTRRRIASAILELSTEDALETFKQSDVRVITELQPDHDDYIHCKSILLRHMGNAPAFDSVQVLSIHRVYTKHIDDRWLKWKRNFFSRSDRNGDDKRVRIGFYTTDAKFVDTACINGIYPSLHKNNPNNEKDRWYGDPKKGVYISKTCVRSLQHLLPNVSIDSLDDEDQEPTPTISASSSLSMTDINQSSGPQQTLRIFDVIMVECIPGKSYQFQDFWQMVPPKSDYDSHLSKDGKEWYLFGAEKGQLHPLFKLKLLAISSSAT